MNELKQCMKRMKQFLNKRIVKVLLSKELEFIINILTFFLLQTFKSKENQLVLGMEQPLDLLYETVLLYCIEFRFYYFLILILRKNKSNHCQ